MYIYVCICVYVFICMYLHMYVYVCIYVYVCVCMFMYVLTYMCVRRVSSAGKRAVLLILRHSTIGLEFKPSTWCFSVGCIPIMSHHVIVPIPS